MSGTTIPRVGPIGLQTTGDQIRLVVKNANGFKDFLSRTFADPGGAANDIGYGSG